MVATHVLPDRDADGSLSLAYELAGGRASALFALLAGVSVALAVPGEGRRRALLVRAALIAAIGLLLGQLESGLAVILTYYGVLFALALPFVRWPARWLLTAGAAWVIAGPVLSQLVRPHLPERRFANPVLAQLEDPGPLLSELLFTGYYPAVPWLAYLLVGMGVYRLGLDRRPVQLGLVGLGAALTLVVPLLSRALTPFDVPETSLHGTTPTDGRWAWLLVDSPHSATPLDLAGTLGSGLLVLGACLLLAASVGRAGRVFLAVLFGAGTMTLSLYSLHAVLRTPRIWPADHGGVEVYLAHVVVLLAVGAAYVAAGRRGPLERMVAAASRAARQP